MHSLHYMWEGNTGMGHNYQVLKAVLLVFFMEMADAGKYSSSRYFLASHSNFLRANFHGGGMTAGTGEVRCYKNATICSDLVRNPRGGICCFNSVCRQIETDESNCGACNNACGYGLTCCGGKCVNLMTDNSHCGGCDTWCRNNVSCEFGICGYAGGYDEVDSSSRKHRKPKQW